MAANYFSSSGLSEAVEVLESQSEEKVLAALKTIESTNDAKAFAGRMIKSQASDARSVHGLLEASALSSKQVSLVMAALLGVVWVLQSILAISIFRANQKGSN